MTTMNKIKFNAKNYLDTHKNIFDSLDLDKANECIEIIKDKFHQESQIFTCGNGGSAHTANHMITDWNKMITLATGKLFRGYPLAANTGIITAYANDLSYDDVFSGQLNSLMKPEDLLIAVSGSGNSPNVLKAAEYANSIGADTLAIVGYDGGELINLCKYSFHVPIFDMQICEDIHLMFNHMVMKELCGNDIHIK